MRVPRRTNFPGAANQARRYREMGIDTSIVARRPVLAVGKEIGEPGLRDKVVAVLLTWSMVKSADHKCNNGSYVRWNTPTPDSRRFDPVPRFRYLTLPYY